MSRQEIRKVLEGLVEQLAAIEHERWSHWQRYMHEKAIKQSDGSLIIPRELVRKWELQIATPYSELTEEEKSSDREQVARYLPLIRNALEDLD